MDKPIPPRPEKPTISPRVWLPEELIDTMRATYAKPQTPVTTGWSALDEVLFGGLKQEYLYLLQGVSGAGKTILANQIADFASAQHAVVYVSAGEPPMELLCKTLARKSQIAY